MYKVIKKGTDQKVLEFVNNLIINYGNSASGDSIISLSERETEFFKNILDAVSDNSNAFIWLVKFAEQSNFFSNLKPLFNKKNFLRDFLDKYPFFTEYFEIKKGKAVFKNDFELKCIGQQSKTDVNIYKQDLLAADKKSPEIVCSNLEINDPMKLSKILLPRRSGERKFRNILIFGESGLGKTSILSRISACSHALPFRNVFNISLIHMFTKAKCHRIRKSLQQTDIANFGRINNEYNSYICQETGCDSYSSFRETVFFLDGLDELTAQKVVESDLVYRILFEIRLLLKSDEITVVFTNRGDMSTLPDILVKSLYNDAAPVITQYTLSGVTDKIDQSIFDKEYWNSLSESEKNEILKTFSLPIYYNFYTELLKENRFHVKSSRQLIEEFYERLVYQRLENHNNSQEDSDIYFLLFRLFIPYIANHMESRLEYTITDQELTDIVNDICKKIKNNPEFIEAVEGEKMIHYRLGSVSAPAVINRLKNIDIFVYDKNRSSFSHNIWKTFLCEKYIIDFLKNMKSCKVPVSFECFPSFNLNNDIQSNVIKDLSICCNINKNIDDEKTKEALLNALFFNLCGCEDDYRRAERESDCKLLLKVLCEQAYLLFELTDNFRFHISDAVGRMLEPYINIIKEVSKNNNVSDILGEERKLYLLKITSAMFQYYRTNGSGEKSDELYCFDKDVLDLMKLEKQQGMKKKLFLLIRHAYTKACLFRICSEEKPDRDKFMYYLHILDQNCKNNYSANLAGTMFERPICKIDSFIAEYIGNDDRYEKAFYAYYSAFTNLSGSDGSLYIETGTELLYTVRQMLSSIVKGYIQIKEEIINKKLIVSALYNGNYAKPTAGSLSFMKKALEKIEGHNDPFLFWILAMIELYGKPDHDLKLIIDLLLKNTNNDEEKTINYMSLLTLRLSSFNLLEEICSSNNNELMLLLSEKILGKSEIIALDELKVRIDELLRKAFSAFAKLVNKQDMIDQLDRKYLIRDAVIFCHVNRADDYIISLLDPVIKSADCPSEARDVIDEMLKAVR